MQKGGWLPPKGAAKGTTHAANRDGWRLVVGYREFVDDAGAMWRVWDTHPVAASTLRTVSPSYAGGWLTFESDTERRRLAPIPAGWEIATRDLMMHWCARALLARSLDREPRPPDARRLQGDRGAAPDLRSPSSTR